MMLARFQSQMILYLSDELENQTSFRLLVVPLYYLEITRLPVRPHACFIIVLKW